MYVAYMQVADKTVSCVPNAIHAVRLCVARMPDVIRNQISCCTYMYYPALNALYVTGHDRAPQR